MVIIRRVYGLHVVWYRGSFLGEPYLSASLAIIYYDDKIDDTDSPILLSVVGYAQFGGTLDAHKPMMRVAWPSGDQSPELF